MITRITRVFFLLSALALLAISAFATPVYNYDYQYVPIGTPSGTSSGSCSLSGASTVCVDAGTSASQYLELWSNSGSDADEGWSWANSTVDNTSFSSLWKNVSTSNDSGGASVFMSLNLWDTLSSSAGIWSDGLGTLNVWNDSQHRWRWELYNVTSQWTCAVPGDPCTSSGTWTSATWGYTIGENEWRNFVNGVLADSGQNPYAFSWGPNNNGGGWGSSGDSVPEPGTGSTFLLGGLGMIVMARAGKMRRWYARLIRARR